MCNYFDAPAQSVTFFYEMIKENFMSGLLFVGVSVYDGLED